MRAFSAEFPTVALNLHVEALGAVLALLKEGIGWGNMPRPMIEADLAAGHLIELDMPDDTGTDYRLSGIYRTDAPPGPAASWLLEHFREGGAGGSQFRSGKKRP